MTPETEARLCILIEQAIEGNKRVEAKIDNLADRISRMEGKQDVMLTWLQSTDQRFTAIMAPYQQRQAS